jgi:uncharacterized protein YlaN (UPF0358 family)
MDKDRKRRVYERLFRYEKEIDHLRKVIIDVLSLPSVDLIKQMEKEIFTLKREILDLKFGGHNDTEQTETEIDAPYDATDRRDAADT